MRCHLLTGLLLLPLTTAQSTVHLVPLNYPTIQAAVDAAASDDSIHVSPGTYAESVTVNAKTVFIIGLSGPDMTTLSSFAWMHSGTTDTGGSLEGFSILGNVFGSGTTRDVWVRNCVLQASTDIVSSIEAEASFEGNTITIEDCTVEASMRLDQRNFTDGIFVRSCNFIAGTFVAVSESSVNLEDCDASNETLSIVTEILLVRNCRLEGVGLGASLDYQGGLIETSEFSNAPIGIDLSGGTTDVRIRDNDIRDCGTGVSIDDPFGGVYEFTNNTVTGCATAFDCEAEATVEGNTIWDCGDGIVLHGRYSPTTGNTIANCTGTAIRQTQDVWLIERNIASDCAVGIEVLSDTDSTRIACNDVWGYATAAYVGLTDQTGLRGNLSADPLFCQVEVDNYALEDGSPCRPGNHPDGADCGFIGAVDSDCMVVGVPDTPSSPSVVVHVYPSPVHSRAIVQLEGGIDGNRVTIFDVSGREVSTLRLDDRGTGVWDLTNAAGQRVANGVYFLRVPGRHVVSERIVVVR